MAFGAAKIDNAYAGIEATIGVVDAFKSRIVAAMESGVDRTKIQGELAQLKQQAVSIATSVSFSGQNWLNTDIADIYDQSNSRTTLTTGLVRQGSSVRATTTDVDLAELSLFNTMGGGVLEKDDRSPGTIGGLRNTGAFTYGGGAIQSFTFDGPLVFTDDSTAITFDMILDADDPSNTTSPGGGTTVSVTLNRTLMDQVYPTLNGVISSRDQFAWLVREAIIPLGSAVCKPQRYDRRIRPPVPKDLRPDGVVHPGARCLLDTRGRKDRRPCGNRDGRGRCPGNGHVAHPKVVSRQRL